MESEATLVWAQGGVELNSVSAVDLYLALIVFPDDTELDDSLRDRDNLESGLVFRILLEKSGMFEGGDQLCE